MNCGSLNIDVEYWVKEIVKPGETIKCKERCLLPGVESGVLYVDKCKRIGQKAFLEYATKASALCIKKLGTAVSIPAIDAAASFQP